MTRPSGRTRKSPRYPACLPPRSCSRLRTPVGPVVVGASPLRPVLLRRRRPPRAIRARAVGRTRMRARRPAPEPTPASGMRTTRPTPPRPERVGARGAAVVVGRSQVPVLLRRGVKALRPTSPVMRAPRSPGLTTSLRLIRRMAPARAEPAASAAAVGAVGARAHVVRVARALSAVAPTTTPRPLGRMPPPHPRRARPPRMQLSRRLRGPCPDRVDAAVAPVPAPREGIRATRSPRSRAPPGWRPSASAVARDERLDAVGPSSPRPSSWPAGSPWTAR